jgi:hypothetical protein
MKRCYFRGTSSEAKNVNLFWAQDCSGLGFPPHGSTETQLNDALIASGTHLACCGYFLLTQMLYFSISGGTGKGT